MGNKQLKVLCQTLSKAMQKRWYLKLFSYIFISQLAIFWGGLKDFWSFSWNFQAVNVGFWRVFALVSDGFVSHHFWAWSSNINMHWNAFFPFNFQAKPDAGKIFFATVALLIASTTNLLIVCCFLSNFSLIMPQIFFVVLKIPLFIFYFDHDPWLFEMKKEYKLIAVNHKAHFRNRIGSSLTVYA